jgi:hypothetical protein
MLGTCRCPCRQLIYSGLVLVTRYRPMVNRGMMYLSCVPPIVTYGHLSFGSIYNVSRWIHLVKYLYYFFMCLGYLVSHTMRLPSLSTAEPKFFAFGASTRLTHSQQAPVCSCSVRRPQG